MDGSGTESGLDTRSAGSPAGGQAEAPAVDPECQSDDKPRRRARALASRVRSLVQAIKDNDEARIEEAVLRLSRSRRIFAPLAFLVGSFVLLFDGLRLLVTNWEAHARADPSRDVDLACGV